MGHPNGLSVLGEHATFNAATTGWGGGLGGSPDPTIERITRNVLTRLCDRWPARDWERIGHANAVTALVACENLLFAADTANVCLRFDQLGSPTAWTRIGHANDVVAMTNLNGRLFCVTRDRTLWMRQPLLHEVNWTAIGTAPAAATGLAGHAGKLFLSTATGQLWWRDAMR